MAWTAWLDDFGRPAWIVATIVAFLVAWPLGVLMVGIMIGSGRMGCWADPNGGPRWQRRMNRFQRGMERMQQGIERMQARATRWSGPGPGTGPYASSGNHAFDEYRADTLRRLEDEQREFIGFLDRLRHAKDKTEFDQFMAERRGRPTGPASDPQY